METVTIKCQKCGSVVTVRTLDQQGKPSWGGNGTTVERLVAQCQDCGRAHYEAEIRTLLP